MYDKAKKRLEGNIRTDIKDKEAFYKYFSQASRFIKDEDDNTAVAFVKGKWSGDPESEELLKALKTTIRNIPFEQSGTKGECLLTGKKDAAIDVIYARTY
jgi:prolyl-tRNA synthetase